MLPPKTKKRATGSRDSHFRVTRSSRARTEKPAASLVTAIEESVIALSDQDLDDARELLRQFDMTFKYGPCVGIKRTARWKRAKRLELNPPEEVINILQDKRYQDAIPDLDLDLWHKEMNTWSRP